MSGHLFGFITLLLNVSLAFFSGTLVIQAIISVFRLKNPRIRSLLRICPMIIPGLDLFLSKFSIGNFLNPLSCESCLQNLFLYFSPKLKSYLFENHVTLNKFLVSEFPQFPFAAVLFAFSLITALIFLCKIPRIIAFFRHLKALIRNAKVCQRAIENDQLKARLQRQKVAILVSEEIKIPMAVYGKTIMIPKNLAMQFPQNEFEAVLAHELEHLRWKDPFVKLFNEIIVSLFWWVPMRWWLKRLNSDQELACDEIEKCYGLEKEALASALIKVAKCHKDFSREPVAALCGLSGESHTLLMRLQMILDPTNACQKKLLRFALTGTAIGALILLSCLMLV